MNNSWKEYGSLALWNGILPATSNSSHSSSISGSVTRPGVRPGVGYVSRDFVEFVCGFVQAAMFLKNIFKYSKTSRVFLESHSLKIQSIKKFMTGKKQNKPSNKTD